MKVFIGCLAVLFSVAQPISAGGPLIGQRDALRGLNKISVSAMILIPEILQTGLIDEEWLRIKVELSCRSSYISVEDTLTYPQLQIQLQVNMIDPEYYVFAMSLDLVDLALPQHQLNKRKFYESYIWTQQIFGGHAKGDFRTNVEENVKELMDRFLNDYLAANPKDGK